MEKMIPVLSVSDISNARDHLINVFGFEALDGNKIRFGDAEIIIVSYTDIPKAIIRKPIDHIAFSVQSLAEFESSSLGRNGYYHSEYTPEGIKEIPEFWESGVKYVFFEGPDGAPFEFCCRNSIEAAEKGVDHVGIRNLDINEAQSHYLEYSPKVVSEYKLDDVNIRFFTVNEYMFEAFTAVGDNGMDSEIGWIGFIRQD